MRMLDLFCGKWGWSSAFAERGWECIGVDLIHSPETQPERSIFCQSNILDITPEWVQACAPDYICCSSCCEQFSVHGLKCFHKSPPYPELGIRLFNHARYLCEASARPYIMENVRAAQGFVGNAVSHCGSFYLWGSGVPPILPQGISKGMKLAGMSGAQSRAMTREERLIKRRSDNMLWSSSKSAKRKAATAQIATIPPELASCVANYAERLLEMRQTA